MGGVLVFDETEQASVVQVDESTFVVFDAPVLDPIETPSQDFLLIDGEQLPAQVIREDGETDVLVLTSGGPPGPPGPAGEPGGSYQHVQSTPAAEWTVVHNLGRYPVLTLRLTANPEEPVSTDITYVDDNTALVTWPSPESGWADA